MGLFAAPNPVDWVESIKDENLKRAAIQLGMSAAYSQYITGLYELGTSLQGKALIGVLGNALVKMAASTFKLLQLQDTEKLIYLSVPKALVDDVKLLDSIYAEKIQQK